MFRSAWWFIILLNRICSLGGGNDETCSDHLGMYSECQVLLLNTNNWTKGVCITFLIVCFKAHMMQNLYPKLSESIYTIGWLPACVCNSCVKARKFRLNHLSSTSVYSYSRNTARMYAFLQPVDHYLCLRTLRFSVVQLFELEEKWSLHNFST